MKSWKEKVMDYIKSKFKRKKQPSKYKEYVKKMQERRFLNISRKRRKKGLDLSEEEKREREITEKVKRYKKKKKKKYKFPPPETLNNVSYYTDRFKGLGSKEYYRNIEKAEKERKRRGMTYP